LGFGIPRPQALDGARHVTGACWSKPIVVVVVANAGFELRRKAREISMNFQLTLEGFPYTSCIFFFLKNGVTYSATETKNTKTTKRKK
jgi:hypothetical protein